MHPHTELDWVNRRGKVPPLRRQVRGLQGKGAWQGNHRRDDVIELEEATATGGGPGADRCPTQKRVYPHCYAVSPKA